MIDSSNLVHWTFNLHKQDMVGVFLAYGSIINIALYICKNKHAWSFGIKKSYSDQHISKSVTKLISNPRDSIEFEFLLFAWQTLDKDGKNPSKNLYYW